MGLDIFSSIVVIITITMIVVNIGGLMYWWHITLNAVSLVNLVMVSHSIMQIEKEPEKCD
jgi:Niemann-Pick C1 protein